MLVALLLILIVWCLHIARTAQPATVSVLRAREHRQTVTLHRVQGTVRFFGRHPWLLRYGQQRWVARRELRRARVWVRVVRRELAETRAALHPPVRWLDAWLCIHSHEGAWNANTGNGYYGGLQMDMAFQRHYGSWLLAWKGTADHWTPLEQMIVAERSGGFSDWPNTARICGLR